MCSNIKIIDALVNVALNKESLAVKRRSYEVLLNCEDGALSSTLPLNPGWLLPIIIDLLSAAEDDEHRDFFRQVIERLFGKLKISPSLDDVKKLRKRITEFSDRAINILLKKETQSSNFTIDVLAAVIRVFSPLFTKGVDIDLVNSVSNLCKHGFVSTDTSTMLKAYKAWQNLIGVFALTKDWSNYKIEVNKKNDQFLTMLLKPIIYKTKFIDIHILLEKLETWVVLVKSVGQRLQYVFDQLVVPLLMYCLGCTLETCKRDTMDGTVELLSVPINENRRLFIYCTSKMEKKHFVLVPILYVHAIRLLNGLLLTNGELAHAFSTPKQVTEFSVLMAQCLRMIASIISAENNEIAPDERQEIKAALPNLWFALVVCIFNTLKSSDELEVQRRLLFTQISAFSKVDAISTSLIDVCLFFLKKESLLAISKFEECEEFASSIISNRIKSQLEQPDNNLSDMELVENSVWNSTEQPDFKSSQPTDVRETRSRKRKTISPLSNPDEDLLSTTITLRPRRTCAVKMTKMTKKKPAEEENNDLWSYFKRYNYKGTRVRCNFCQKICKGSIPKCLLDHLNVCEGDIPSSLLVNLKNKHSLSFNESSQSRMIFNTNAHSSEIEAVDGTEKVKLYGMEPEADDEEEETKEKVENSTVSIPTKNLTKTTRIPVFARNAKKLGAAKCAPKSVNCGSSSSVSSSTVNSDGLSSGEQALKSQSQDDGICTVCRESFIKSVVVSPLMDDCALDRTQIEDDVNVNARNTFFSLSSSFDDECASEEAESMNVNSNSIDDRERFANSQSVFLYTENNASEDSGTNFVKDHRQKEVTNPADNVDSCTSITSMGNTDVDGGTASPVAQLNKPLDEVIGDALPGGILKKLNSPASVTKRNLRVHFEPRVDDADSQPCAVLDKITSPNTSMSVSRKTAAARGLFLKPWSSPRGKTSPGGFFVFPDSPNNKENSDVFSLSSPTRRQNSCLPLNMLNNAAVTNNKTTVTESCVTQSQRREEPITLMLCQKLAQHPGDSKRMLEKLKNRNITTVSALCCLGNTELEQLRIRKANWKALRFTMQRFPAGNNNTMFKTSTNGGNNAVKDVHGTIGFTAALKQPKDQEESEVAIMDSITSDKEVTGQLGAVDGLDSVQTTTNEDSKEGFQDFHPIVAQSMQLAKSIQELNPAFMSPEALEDVKKQCSTNAIDILKHLLSL